MNIFKKLFILFIIALCVGSCTPSTSKNDICTYILMKTTLGDITVRLYDETPVHRDNFIKLVNSHVFDGVSFHRVIKNFMIQAGDPETKIDYIKGTIDSLLSYTIPAEFNPKYFHKKGALAAAREAIDINPEMRSSGTQFYIVQGVTYSDNELNLAEQRINNNIKQTKFSKILKEISDSSRISGTNLTLDKIKEKAAIRMLESSAINIEYRISEEQRNIYKKIGGTPRLDGTYTVFGEVVSGLQIVDKIAAVKTDASDKPISDIRIIKMKLVRK
jgi:peptidylprolyl isomerase